MKRVGTPEVISEQNKRLILKLLRNRGPLSRADISRMLGMSFPTVSSNVKSLIDSEYVLEVGSAENTVGRRATLVAFHANRGFIIGVDVGRFFVRVMLADLVGTPLATAQEESHGTHSGSENIALILKLINEVLEKSACKQESILCVSIGIPGVLIDGSVQLAPYFYFFTEKEITDAVKGQFPDAHILIENCVNLGAIGEKWRGAGRGCQNFIYVNYGIGLGAALIINDNLYRGPNGVAGEIGFMLTSPQSMRRSYEPSGVLEQLLTGNEINGHLSHKDFKNNMGHLIEKYQSGDANARRIIDGIGLELTALLINLTAVLNPERIILSGGIGVNIGRLFQSEWEEQLRRHVPFVPKLCFSTLDHQETLLGAVAAASRIIHRSETSAWLD